MHDVGSQHNAIDAKSKMAAEGDRDTLRKGSRRRFPLPTGPLVADRISVVFCGKGLTVIEDFL